MSMKHWIFRPLSPAEAKGIDEAATRELKARSALRRIADRAYIGWSLTDREEFREIQQIALDALCGK